MSYITLDIDHGRNEIYTLWSSTKKGYTLWSIPL